VSRDGIHFAILLAFAWLGFRVLPWRGWVLLVAGATLYSAAGLRDSAITAAIIVVNYAFQFAIVRDRRWLTPALVVNVGCLAYFKYQVFLSVQAGADLFTGPILIPVGISFHVFQLCRVQALFGTACRRPDHALAAIRTAGGPPVRRQAFARRPIGWRRARPVRTRPGQEDRVGRPTRAFRRHDLSRRAT
jgi:D-alanyl-lipoteichoic acid acyltransferase DltB (MBOAT superfamily)